MAVTTKFRDSSQRLIARFGTLRKYKHKTGEVYNLDTQKNEVTFSELDIKAFRIESLNSPSGICCITLPL